MLRKRHCVAVDTPGASDASMGRDSCPHCAIVRRWLGGRSRYATTLSSRLPYSRSWGVPSLPTGNNTSYTTINEDGMRETPFLDSMPPRSWYFPVLYQQTMRGNHNIWTDRDRQVLWKTEHSKGTFQFTLPQTTLDLLPNLGKRYETSNAKIL